MGVSARTQTKVPSQVSIGVSNKSPVSQRDRIEQVTEGRFEPTVFDVAQQTETKIVPPIKTQTNETTTEPVRMTSPKQFSTFMVQTDPMIDELVSLEHPVPSQLPFLSELHEKLMLEPSNELIAAIELPQPQEPEEEMRDWADSALFAYVESEFRRVHEGKEVGGPSYDPNFDNLK